MFKTLKYLEINLIRKNIRLKKNNLLRIIKEVNKQRIMSGSWRQRFNILKYVKYKTTSKFIWKTYYVRITKILT